MAGTRPFKISLRLRPHDIHRSKEGGFTLIETVVAIAIVAFIAAAILIGASTSLKATAIRQERSAAQSLAYSQLEYIQSQDYIAADAYDPDDPSKSYAMIVIPEDLVAEGYSIEMDPPVNVSLPAEGSAELESIQVVVKRHGETKLKITDYKAGLSL
jgi:prepilin-type N-terminal cleavage/methylation domain-containing protein